MPMVEQLLGCGNEGSMLVQARGWGHHIRWGYVNGWGGVIMMLVWTLLLVALIYFLVRGVSAASKGVPEAGEESALDILKRRYAKGEMTREEFQRVKQDLE